MNVNEIYVESKIQADNEHKQQKLNGACVAQIRSPPLHLLLPLLFLRCCALSRRRFAASSALPASLSCCSLRRPWAAGCCRVLLPLATLRTPSLRPMCPPSPSPSPPRLTFAWLVASVHARAPAPPEVVRTARRRSRSQRRLGPPWRIGCATRNHPRASCALRPRPVARRRPRWRGAAPSALRRRRRRPQRARHSPRRRPRARLSPTTGSACAWCSAGGSGALELGF